MAYGPNSVDPAPEKVTLVVVCLGRMGGWKIQGQGGQYSCKKSEVREWMGRGARVVREDHQVKGPCQEVIDYRQVMGEEAEATCFFVSQACGNWKLMTKLLTGRRNSFYQRRNSFYQRFNCVGLEVRTLNFW